MVNYVVTSVQDAFDPVNNGEALRSLREAIHSANANDGVAEVIWAPAWNFVLTRKSSTPSAFDHDIQERTFRTFVYWSIQMTRGQGVVG